MSVAQAIKNTTRLGFNPYRAMEIIERAIGEPLTTQEVNFIRQCPSLRDLFEEYISGALTRAMFIKGNFQSQYKMAQVAVAILADATLDLTAGRDAVGLYPHPTMDAIEAGKIEVKSGGPEVSADAWTVELAGKKGEPGYDVMVFLGYTKTYNPMDGVFICIPRGTAEAEIATLRARGNTKREPTIGISRNRYHRLGGKLNRWYEYEVANPYNLRGVISQYIHGVPLQVVGEQLVLF
jgi:hypothetical protein